jgi:hypothetical protein
VSLRRMAVAVFSLWLGVVLPTYAAAPPGWVIAGTAPTDFEFSVDPTTAASGKSSALITAKPGAKSGGFGTLMQSIAADNYRGGRWRLSGFLRTDAANRAQMWMRVDGPGAKILGFDNMDSRPVTATTQWTRYEVVLDVPMESVDIAFGFGLIGSGRVWGDDFKLEKVDTTVPITSAGPTLAQAPVNPDFEDTGSSQTAGAAALNEMATWEPRTLKHFATVNGASCDYLVERIRFELLQLGARDLKIDERDCLAKANIYAATKGVDATFSVLVPANKSDGTARGDLVQARWQIVEFHRGDFVLSGCADLNYVTLKVLPLFSTRDIKNISKSVCDKTDVGLRAQVLMPTQPLATPAAAAAVVTAAATTGASEAANSRQTAVWEPRTLKNFGSSTLDSCEGIAKYLRVHLIELGARASDLHIDKRPCDGAPRNVIGESGDSNGSPINLGTIFRSVDATFSVLVPANKSDAKARGEMVEARWQIVEMRQGAARRAREFGELAPGTEFESCANLKYLTQTILPLFSVRDVKLISKEICDKTDIGLRAEVLVPATQKLEESR